MCKIPFIYKRALHVDKDHLVLIKRKNEINKACSALDRGLWLSSCCGRKVGKTTFIAAVKKAYKSSHPNANFIHVNFAGNRLRSFFDLRQIIQNNARKFTPAKGRKAEFEEKLYNKKTCLSQYFLQLDRTVMRNRQYIFIFDGLDAITRHFLHYVLNELLRLSHEFENEKGNRHFQFFIAGCLGRNNLQLGDEIVFTECTFRIFLEDFSFSQVEHQLRSIAEKLNIEIEHGFIQLIFEQTCGMAYLIQKICSKILEAANLEDIKPVFSLKSAKSIIAEILREGDSVVDNIIWRLEKNEVFIENIVRVLKNGVLQGHFYDRDLQPLVSIGALVEKNGNYFIRNPIFQKIFQDYFTSERIADQFFKKGDFRKSRELYFNVITEQIEAKSALTALQVNSEAIMAALNSANPYDEILTHLSSSLRGVQNCSIMLLDPTTETLKVEASVGIEPDVQRSFRLNIGEGIAGKVAATGQSRYIHDITNTVECPDYVGQSSALKHNLGAMLSLPLAVEGQVLGVLNITLRKPSTFNESEVKILEVLAQQLSLVIRTRPLQNRTSQYGKYVILLEDLIHFLDSNIEYGNAFEAILRTVQHITNSSLNYIVFRKQQNGEFIYKFAKDAPAYNFPPPEFPDEQIDIVGEVLQTGEPFITTNAQKSGHYLPVWKTTKAMVVLPLKVDGEISGCLVICDRRSALYDEMQHKVFSTLATLTASAIRKYRLYGLAERQVQQVISLTSIGEAISHEHKLEKIIELSIRECLIMVGRANRKAFLFLQDDEKDELCLRAACDENLQILKIEKKLPLLSSSSVSRCLREGKAIIENEMDLTPESLKLTADARSEIAVPLFFRDQKLGALCIQSLLPEDFDSNDSQALMTVTTNAAVALTIGKLCDTNEARYKETEALYKIGKTINSSIGIKTVLRTVCNVGQAALGNGHRSLLVFLLDEGSQTSGVQISINPLTHKLIFSHQTKAFEDLESIAIRTRKPQRVMHTQNNLHYKASSPAVKSALILPMPFNENVVGLIKMESNQPDDFTDVDLRLLNGLAHQAGLAIHNARTSEGLVQTQIRLSNALEKAAIEEAITGLTHDIKNILSNIVSETQWLHKLAKEKTIRQSDIDAALDDISGSLYRIEEFTVDINNRSTGSKPEFALVPAKQLINDALALFGIEKWRTISLNKDVQAETVYLKVDKARMTRAIFNVITNAVDAMGDRGKLTVSGRLEDDRYIITIIDTGCGIEQDQLNSVFDPFITTKNKGFGIGLALTKRIVQSEHGGKIRLKSKKNKGTTFMIELPVPDQNIMPAGRNGHSDDKGLRKSRAAQILVINDDKSILSKLKRHLHNDGYIVTGSMLGLNGVKKCSETQFDLVIIDYHLEKDHSATCTADDFIAELRSALPGKPVILTSATARPQAINTTAYDCFVVLDNDFWYNIHQIVSTILKKTEQYKKPAMV